MLQLYNSTSGSVASVETWFSGGPEFDSCHFCFFFQLRLWRKRYNRENFAAYQWCLGRWPLERTWEQQILTRSFATSNGGRVDAFKFYPLNSSNFLVTWSFFNSPGVRVGPPPSSAGQGVDVRHVERRQRPPSVRPPRPSLPDVRGHSSHDRGHRLRLRKAGGRARRKNCSGRYEQTTWQSPMKLHDGLIFSSKRFYLFFS